MRQLERRFYGALVFYTGILMTTKQHSTWVLSRVSLNFIVIAKKTLFSKLSSLINIGSDQFSSSKAIVNEINESSGQDSDEIRDVRSRKIRIIDSETNSETIEDADSSQWIRCGDSEEMTPRLFFINRFVKEIVSGTNNYAKKKLEGKTLSSNSIWRSWRDVTNEEFWAFITIIIDISIMQLANLQEYRSRNNIILIREHVCNEVYTLADSNTGYICGILPYYGSLTIQQLVGPDVPVSMIIPIHF
ncbi:hypothetical protein HZH66_014667 [Vespula vulgaris]|uniref:PiggyBac transposable element-derived protein domain-containing protein n=1 Tax=Vespula vulgaris TaxID=7454 RepID=A0A834MPA5_VESVU|nr:hypothetical protein HZH66_014667 [Vespula vulgaris]